MARSSSKRKQRASPEAPDAATPQGYPTKGFRIGEYLIQDILGHGAMSTVFLATDGTNHQVALKVLQEGPHVSETMLERFRREVEACKILRPHPHIITVYDTGRDGPNHYIAMQYVEQSRTLERLLDDGRLSSEEAMQIAIKIARALQFAHAHQIVHRDIKPNNIMINRFGEPLLADFGTAALTSLPSFTVFGALTGTPLYMSPEQARGERATPQSDIYALGVVLFEMLTGCLPYRMQHLSPVRQVLRAVQTQPPRRPSTLRRNLPRDIDMVLFKALEKDPTARYADAESFARDIENVMHDRKVDAMPLTPAYFIRHFLFRYRRSLATVGLLLLAGFGLWFHLNMRIMEARYEGLSGLARLRAAEQALADRAGEPNEIMVRTPAWNEIRRARRIMAAANWAEAEEVLRQAIALSMVSRDLRTAAIGQLDQARCLTLMNQPERAAALYMDILQNPDASPPTLHKAQLEGAILALKGHTTVPLEEWLLPRRPGHHRLLEPALRCLAGDLPPEQLIRDLHTFPARLQNDVLFAAAIRSLADGQRARAVAYLQDCVRFSRGAEWPGVYARQLLREIRP